jgi:hypothetical protein
MNEAKPTGRATPHPLDDASDICRMSVAELTTAYAKGSLSPVEAARATLQRAEDINPRYNAFVSIDHEDAHIAAKASEKRWRAGAPSAPAVHRAQDLDVANGVKAEAFGDPGLYQLQDAPNGCLGVFGRHEVEVAVTGRRRDQTANPGQR